MFGAKVVVRVAGHRSGPEIKRSAGDHLPISGRVCALRFECSFLVVVVVVEVFTENVFFFKQRDHTNQSRPGGSSH